MYAVLCAHENKCQHLHAFLCKHVKDGMLHTPCLGKYLCLCLCSHTITITVQYGTLRYSTVQYGWCCRGTVGLRAELSSRNMSEYDLDRAHIETSAASFTSFNSEEGFGSPASRRNKDRPNVFDMDDNDLKVLWPTAIGCPRA